MAWRKGNLQISTAHKYSGQEALGWDKGTLHFASIYVPRIHSHDEGEEERPIWNCFDHLQFLNRKTDLYSSFHILTDEKDENTTVNVSFIKID